MNCREITNDALADLVLDPGAPKHSSGPLFEHLASCDACRRRAAEIKAVFAAVDARLEAVPGALDAAVRSFKREPAAGDQVVTQAIADGSRQAFRALFRRHGLTAGAAAAAALVGVLFGFAIAGSGGRANLEAGRETVTNSEPEARIARYQERIVSLESRLSAETARYTALAAETARIRDDAVESERKASALAKELEAAGTQAANLKEKLAESLKSGKEAWEAATAVQSSRDSLLARVGKLETDLDRGDRELAQAKDLAFRVERDSAAIKAALAAARAENETLVARSEELVSAISVRGDMNGDGTADVADSMRIVLLAAAGKEVAYSTPADLNADGKVDVADAMLIARMSTGGAR